MGVPTQDASTGHPGVTGKGTLLTKQEFKQLVSWQILPEGEKTLFQDIGLWSCMSITYHWKHHTNTTFTFAGGLPSSTKHLIRQFTSIVHFENKCRSKRCIVFKRTPSLLISCTTVAMASRPLQTQRHRGVRVSGLRSERSVEVGLR